MGDRAVARVSAACPKAMTYGPCGGVRADGLCELGTLPCPFVDEPMLTLAGESAPPDSTAVRAAPRAARLRARLAEGGAVVGDLPARALDAASLAECARTLTGLDAVLSGDAPHARVQFPPTHRARLIHDAGAVAWVGLNCRDRNRVALEAELAALADLEVAAVHCVTGDHPACGSRPDAPGVFDLDAVGLTALAAQVLGPVGPVISVGESPAAPPRSARPARLALKLVAGAEVCFVNHCGGPTAVASFVRAARAQGVTAAMLACVPLAVDAASAATLLSFAPPPEEVAELERIINAVDPRRAGITAAIAAGRRMLDTGLVAGIDLSGGPADGGELAYAEAQAEVAAAVRA